MSLNQYLDNNHLMGTRIELTKRTFYSDVEVDALVYNKSFYLGKLNYENFCLNDLS